MTKDNSIIETVNSLTTRARASANLLATATTTQKNHALQAIANELRIRNDEIISANQKDISQNKANLSESQIDRLLLTTDRVEAIAASVEEIMALPDPIGATTAGSLRPNGLRIYQMQIPLGVVLMIFESRPNVAIDAGALCIKSGNAAILRGGKETTHTAKIFNDVYRKAFISVGLPEHSVQLIDNPNRALVSELLTRAGEIDLVIPRGGESLIRAVTDQSRIPVIQHFKGVCHVFVHSTADLATATEIALNAKTQRPGVCNAMETLLVDQDFGKESLLALLAELRSAGVELVGCER